MNSDPYLWHVTLTTGDIRRSYRSEVGDHVVAACRELLERAIACAEGGVRVPIAAIGCQMGVTATSRSLLASVWQDELPLVTIGIAIASNNRAGTLLFRSLTEIGVTTPIHPSIQRCPPEPWCIARIEPGCARASRELLLALGDFERCLAWAFIERTEAN